MSKKNISEGISLIRVEYKKILGNSSLKGEYHNNVGDVKKTKQHAYHRIKRKLIFSELCDAVDFLDKNLPIPYKNLLFGNPLPDSYEILGDTNFFPFFWESGKEKFPIPKFQSEVNWVLIGIRKYAYQINLFLTYKELYERELLLGNYQEAEKYLDKIENEVCFSLWTLENRFLLKEMSNSSIESKEFLNSFNESNKSKTYTKFLAHFLSIKSEKSLSINRYFSDLQISLNNFKGELRNEYIDYFHFKLSYLNNINYEHYQAVLLMDFGHSIIDRYLSLLGVFANILTLTNQVQANKDITAAVNYIANRVNYLLRKVNDPILYKLKLFTSKKLFPAFDRESSKEEINVIDKYTVGLYQETEKDLKNLLSSKPNQFDLYVLYAKTLIYQKKQFQPIGNSQSIQNNILENVYKVISATGSRHQAGHNLLNIANNISSSVLSYGIMDFVYFQTEGKKERELLSRLSYNYANPIISEIYPHDEAKLKYLNLLQSKFPDSITIQFFKSKLNDIDSLRLFENKIPDAKFKTEYAKKLQLSGKYGDAAKIWEELITSHSDTTPIWEVAIRNLYVCYENLNCYDECIKLYVDSFMQNPFIVEQIETESLRKKITKNAFRNVSININLPIFFTLIGADETETHIAFEQFNMSLGIEKPSNLFSKFDNFEKEKILFYLKFTCSPETLRHSPFILNSKERLEERLAISQFLKNIDIEDKQFYDDEIRDIQNILIIQKGLIELDESKIYVNEQGIINNELKDYEAIFTRFKSISKIAEKNRILVFDLRGNITTVNYNEQDRSKETKYSSNPVFDIYLELFEAIKDKFLYSKFGIVTYLSTRIRHGVLIGEIRPIFEKHHLITLKEGNASKYRDNPHWNRIYINAPSSIKEQIQHLLKDFSSLVDGLLFDLIKKYLQVYSAANEDGWFDYDFLDKELLLHSIKSISAKNFNDFSQQAFNILWERTDENLESIRHKIQTDIANQFNTLLDNLERNIVIILGDNSSSLVKEIKNCSTELQVTINKISSWFKRSGTVASDFELNTLIDMVMEYANKSNPYQKINLKRNLQFNCKIEGQYLTHFADLLRIFIENILTHSDKKVSFIDATISTQQQENDFLLITIENTITNKDSLNSLKEVWKHNKIDVEKLQSEKKSGYFKAYKILTSDLKSNIPNCLTTHLNEDESKFGVSIYISLKNLIV
ncbi:MAG: hypothetical protein EAZ08_07335 [Cytophagales bacterium]|nr:MAG: hypothetical protein EAZ08_07335 [Cytophagales bacterium]